MLRILLVIAAMLAAAPSAAVAAADGPADIAYQYDVRVAGPSLTGTGVITVRNNGDAPMRAVWLRLWGNGGWPCADPVVRVRAIGGPPARMAVACTAAAMPLGTPVAPGETATVRLAITARVPDEPFRTGSWGAVRSFGGVLPTVAPVVDGRVDLDRYIATGDPYLLLPASYRVTVTTRPGVAVAASGVPGDALRAPRGWSRREYVTDPAREFNLVTGPMRVRTGTAAGIPVRVFAPRSVSTALADRMLGAATRAVTAFSERYGPYPGRHLDVALLGPDGMEYPSLVLSEATAETVTHEVAHQWFSQEVGSDGWTQPWIDETFTTYVQMRLLGLVRDCDVSAPLRAYRPARLSWTLAQFARYPDDLYQAVYDGGACALEGVARSVGAERFDEILREWVAAHRWGQVRTDEWLAFLGARVPADVLAAFESRTGLAARAGELPSAG